MWVVAMSAQQKSLKGGRRGDGGRGEFQGVDLYPKSYLAAARCLAFVNNIPLILAEDVTVVGCRKLGENS